ncbi:N-acetylmuramoyl-L-alanine amidase [Bacteroidia bacterium]|nr:N-acetylmuramoyl-L-alanine amidase [Bacteroidia bacterium]
MKTHRYLLAAVFCFFLSINGLFAKEEALPYSDYVKKYSDLAIYHMKKHKIPASITLAQGIVETAGGRSEFVKETNNHFGIKCHPDWEGGRYYKADDGPNDCFRTYRKAEDSFEDHSKFLQRTRYDKLFRLEITDYKGWARGLQECGYATDRTYAKKLIKIIEDYELNRFDKAGKKGGQEERPEPNYRRVPYKANGLVYVLAEANDSYEKIASDVGYKVSELRKYNDVPEGFPVRPGEMIYLENKRKKAEKPYFEHVVRAGESMHSISQLYGIHLSQLYKLNKKRYNYVPTEGDVLRLR